MASKTAANGIVKPNRAMEVGGRCHMPEYACAAHFYHQ